MGTMPRLLLLFLALFLSGCAAAVSEPIPLPSAPPEPLELSAHFKDTPAEPFAIRDWQLEPGAPEIVVMDIGTRLIYNKVRARRGDDERVFLVDITIQTMRPKYFQALITDITTEAATPQP